MKNSRLIETLCKRPVASVMVVAAHPDDEVVGAGRHLGVWPDVRIVHVTNGAPRDPRFARWAGFAEPRSYAEARRAEALSALSLAGIAPECLTCLGFDDQQGSRSLVAIARALSAHFARECPDAVVTHPYEGGHPDHDAVCFAVHAALRSLSGQKPCLVEMTSYFGRDGERVVSEFASDSPDTISVRIDEFQRRRKHEMYECFASQFSLLRQFPLEFERFRMAPRYDFLRKPIEVFYDAYELGTTSDQWLDLARAALEVEA